jgi:hypothetical protein
MVNDQQVRKLKNMLQNNKTLRESALCSGMDEKTARKYRDAAELPSCTSKEELRNLLPDMLTPEMIIIS